MKKTAIDPNILIKAGVSLAGLFIVYKILQKTGVLPSKESNQAAQNLQALESSNYWNYTEFLNSAPPGTLLLTQSGAAAYVDTLWDATGWFNDNEEEIYGVFRRMKTQSQIAALAKRFNEMKAQDLFLYLKNYLNEEELLTIKSLIDQKPKYNI